MPAQFQRLPEAFGVFSSWVKAVPNHNRMFRFGGSCYSTIYISLSLLSLLPKVPFIPLHSFHFMLMSCKVLWWYVAWENVGRKWHREYLSFWLNSLNIVYPVLCTILKHNFDILYDRKIVIYICIIIYFHMSCFYSLRLSPCLDIFNA